MPTRRGRLFCSGETDETFFRKKSTDHDREPFLNVANGTVSFETSSSVLLFLSHGMNHFPNKTDRDFMNNTNKTPNKHELERQTQQMTSMILPSRDIPSESSNNRKVHWVGMTPLEWIESLATTTEICESRRLHRPMTPIRIDGEYLANHFHSMQDRKATVDTMLSGNRTGDVTIAMDNTSRTLPIPDGVASSNLPFHSSAYYHDPQKDQPHPSQVPKYWDLSCFEAAGPILLRIRHIVISVESQPNFDKHLRRSYETTRDHCLWTIAVLRSKRGSDPSALDMEKLCRGVLQKLQALLDLSRKLATQEQAHFLSGGQGRSAVDVAIGGLASPGLTTPPCTPGKKQDLSKYMTQWLRENWTNPYPDEIAIQQMSSECGSTSTVISNWLINARTRKWRPSIIKAYEMERPADLLLEDSINIFCGKPVRKLDSILPMVSPVRGNDSKNIGHSPPSSGPGPATKRARKL